jgi:hypothetical protein
VHFGDLGYSVLGRDAFGAVMLVLRWRKIFRLFNKNHVCTGEDTATETEEERTQETEVP